MRTRTMISTIAACLLVSQTASATQAGDILTRFRIINVAPNADSSPITTLNTLAGVNDDATVDVDSKVTLDIDFTYFITDNFGIELLLDTSSVHEIHAAGSINGAGTLGEVRVLPPALIAQYHFSPGSHIRPYAGVGINYTFFLDEETTALTTATVDAAVAGTTVTSTDLEIDDTFSFVAQAGVDVDIDSDWYFNADVKYIALSSDASIGVYDAGGFVAAETISVDINPLVIGFGVGMKF